MSSAVDLYVLYQIANAPILYFPFPHIVVRDVFPADYYETLRSHLPPKDDFKTLRALKRVGDAYPDTRLVLPLARENLQDMASPFRGFWQGVAEWMRGGYFTQVVLSKFGDILVQRLGDLKVRRFSNEALLVQDYTTYALGPHTDKPQKVLSLLFYLPADDSRPHLGTSIYLPTDRNFTCTGGPHYPFDQFQRICTMPYLPNTLFAFVKTNDSFHGVEPIADLDVRRDLLLYDIMVENPPELLPSARTA
jgi:hypothetical protein